MTTLLRDTRGWRKPTVCETRLLEGTTVTLWDALLGDEVHQQVVRIGGGDTASSQMVVTSSGKIIRTDEPFELRLSEERNLGLSPLKVTDFWKGVLRGQMKEIVYDPDPREDLPGYGGRVEFSTEIPSRIVSRGKERL